MFLCWEIFILDNFSGRYKYLYLTFFTPMWVNVLSVPPPKWHVGCWYIFVDCKITKIIVHVVRNFIVYNFCRRYEHSHLFYYHNKGTSFLLKESDNFWKFWLSNRWGNKEMQIIMIFFLKNKWQMLYSNKGGIESEPCSQY